jgi:hypothetical protein
MESLFTCPPPSTLATVPTQACPERWDQIVRLLLMRKQASALFTTTSILVVATWTPLLTASDGTKVIRTPLLSNMVIPPGELLKEGGNDNTTINGIPRLNGRGHVGVTNQLQDVQASTRAALRALASESALQPGFTNLEAVLVNRFGQLIVDNRSGSNLWGFPLYNFIVGDVGTEGFAKSNIANMSFDLAPGWSDNAKVFTPTDFNPMDL